MKAHDAVAVAALRSALGAIDNAEAPGSDHAPAVEAGVIAGGVRGLGAGDVARRELTTRDLELILHREVTERTSAAAEYLAAGREELAAALAAEALVIEGVLDEES